MPLQVRLAVSHQALGCRSPYPLRIRSLLPVLAILPMTRQA